MQLFLIPISTRRALVYSRPLRRNVPKDLSIADRVTRKAAETWAKWEEADRGWKKHLVTWGNRVQQRIPYEEWGLKSIPSLQTQRRHDENYGRTKIDVIFPENAIRKERLRTILRTIATERQDLHRKKMWWSLIAAPFTAPIALIPIVPNIPFFYLVYRGWSHWRALNGSKHLEFLVEKDLLNPVSSPVLEELYRKRLSHAEVVADADKPPSEMVEDVEKSKDTILLQMSDAKQLATVLEAPELALEAERAIVQVQEKLQSTRDSEKDAKGSDTATKKER